jgi:hypothetical protein
VGMPAAQDGIELAVAVARLALPNATVRCPIYGKAMARQQIIHPRGRPPP